MKTMIGKLSSKFAYLSTLNINIFQIALNKYFKKIEFEIHKKRRSIKFIKKLKFQYS